MSDNYLCIHGHFYQPPRENPWLDFIELQTSAKPYHDWNERITRECYGPNVRARIHDQHGHILKLINNYQYMSFDFGPTLLSWLESKHPWIYEQILDAHHMSQKRFEGHGNAMAQVYNHLIMPLASKRDKITQIRWGLADFKYRFGSEAEGMWLAETAVDMETLKLMALEGIKFTVLSPDQAHSVRSLADSEDDHMWKDVAGGHIDTTQPYRVRIDPSENIFIDVFFYHGGLSRGVAYENILTSGEGLLSRIEGSLNRNKQERPRLISVATDGESYGHHFKFGDLALSWLFDHLETSKGVNLTNYALFLERFPPQNEVRLFENSSWSCAHGVERWRSDCGCRVHHVEGWSQSWKTHLRKGLDWLHNKLKTIYIERCGRFLTDPWEARNGYITLLLDRGSRQKDLFLKRYRSQPLTLKEETEALQLIESQRMSMYMFTSCGWFFDEISGLEATQVLKYASRAMDLVKPWAKEDLEKGLIRFLSRAVSNDPMYKKGDVVYRKLVIPSKIGPSGMTANYALLDIEQDPGEPIPILLETVRIVQKHKLNVQNAHACLGETVIEEGITGKKHRRIYIAFRKNRTDTCCIVGEPLHSLDIEQLADELRQGFIEGSFKKMEAIFSSQLIRSNKYGFKDLLPDTCMWLFRYFTEGVNHRIRKSIHGAHEDLIEVISFLAQENEPLPSVLFSAFCLFLNDEIINLMENGPDNNREHWENLRRLAASQSESAVKNLNVSEIRQKAQGYLNRQMKKIAVACEKDRIEDIISLLDLLQELNIEADLWECQNMYYDIYGASRVGTSFSPDRISQYRALGRRLGFIGGSMK